MLSQQEAGGVLADKGYKKCENPKPVALVLSYS